MVSNTLIRSRFSARQLPAKFRSSAHAHGPYRMDIAHPLSRASTVAEIASHEYWQLRDNPLHGPNMGSGYTWQSFYRFSRPKRNVLVNTWTSSRSLPRSIHFPAVHWPRRSLSHAPRSLHRRFFSQEARSRRRERRRFVRWWTLTSLVVLLSGVAARIRYENYGATDEDDVVFVNEYKIKPQLWHLYAYSTLPLKGLSRIWGRVNEIVLPVWLRSPAYRFYSACFGVNLDEMNELDLTKFRNLSEFFYRTLKPGVRPLADSDLVSPSDGKILGFGLIEDGNIEQVKGMTYSVEALLGLNVERLAAPSHSPEFDDGDDDSHHDFATTHGIHKDDLDLDDEVESLAYLDKGDGTAQGLNPPRAKEIAVARNLAPASLPELSKTKQLFFAVIYLAPGDYHRFHSPTNWVATLRRHFIGELFSVAPFFQKTMQGLFVLNERVALLGYWKYGFFSMVPVGATNVGSIVVNFDKDLKTNVVYEDDIYLIDEKAGPTGAKKRLRKNTVYEATYTKASALLGGYPLVKGQEVGGFKLGLTVVLVFEAPSNFQFDLKAGQKVRMGQLLGGFV